METIIEFFQEKVGATYPIDNIISNLEWDDIVEIITEYNQLQIEERLKQFETVESLLEAYNKLNEYIQNTAKY